MKTKFHVRVFAMLVVLFSAGMLAGESSKPKDEKKGDKKEDKGDIKVYVTKSRTKYHLKECKFAEKDATAIPFADTKGKYEPCAVCKPDAMVYVTKTGAKFHMKTCQHAGKDPLAMMLAEARARELEACKVCNPPDGK